MYQYLFKPLLDFFFSMLLILILSPVIFMVGLIIFLRMGRPVLFKQTRPGKNEKPFVLYKFRTMTEEIGEDGLLLPDTERLTRFGKFLRKTSLDELPQLFNIFKGDISFIGPRPLLMEYLLLYNDFQKMRHLVKPGMTGWAQVNGRNTIIWERKFEYDVYYVNHISLLLDILILIKTFINVIKGTGIYNNEGVTMSKFIGSK
jgi:lipopolysaccharide/colanic/teichoic acid biosynthesis glycosyltransferase